MATSPSVASSAGPDSTFRRVLRYPLVTILIGFILFVPIFGIGFSLLSQLIAAALGLRPDDEGQLPLDDPLMGWGQLVASLMLAVLAMYAYRFVIVRWCEGRQSTPELAFGARARTWVPLGLVIGAGVALASVAVLAVAGGGASWATSSIASGIAWALGLSIFAGVIEELFARGTLLRISEQHIGTAAAIVLSASIFGFQHADNPNATVLSTLAVALEGGAMLGLVYVVSRTLWAPIAVHFAWNFTQSVLSIPVSGNETFGAWRVTFDGAEWLTGGEFGLEPSAIAFGLWVIVLVVLAVIAARRHLGQSWAAARAAVADGTANEPVGISG